MNRLDSETRARVVTALMEGNSIASTCRMTGAAKMTVLSLIREVGTACQQFHDAQVRNLGTLRVQADEVWSYCGMKQRRVPSELLDTIGIGSVWTWTALDADSKLLISWLVSNRSQEAADAFIADLKSRTSMRLQITSDGLSTYLDAIAKAFPNPGDVVYGEEIKTYQSSPQPGMSPISAASRYSPGRVQSVVRIPRIGTPIMADISTAYMERWNLTLRMQNRRFTRLTNGFSKRFENHCHMLAISMVFYNFCRKHKSLGGRTPAIAAGLTDYIWTPRDLLALDPTWTAIAA